MPRTPARAVVAAIALAAAISACSSSNGSSNHSSGPPASGQPGSTGPAPRGPAIKLSSLYETDAPEVLAGAQAAAAAINAAGGVASPAGGPARPITILGCDVGGATDANKPSECAQQVMSQGAVLDVGKYTLNGDEDDIFAKAKIAMLGVNPFSASDLTSPFSYPISGAAVSLVPGCAAALIAAGAKKIAYLSLDIPAAHAATGFISPVLGPGDRLVDTVLLPTDPSADLSSYFTQLANANPDGIILGVPAAILAQAVNGLRQAGYAGKFVATPYTLTAAAIKTLGGNADGILSVSNFATISASSPVPAIQAFMHDMKTFEPNAALTEFSLNSWASVQIAAKIGATLPDADATSFDRAVNGYVVNMGIAPSFKLGVKNIFLPFPRVFRATVQYQVVKGGRIVAADGNWVNLNSLATTK